MAPNGSQTLDVIDIEDLIVTLSPKISKAVRRVYRHPTHQCVIEDITQDVLLTLIEDDYRRLRSFDGRSKIETWLHTVIRHCVGQYLRKRRREKDTMNVDDLSPDALSYQPTQEEYLIDEDQTKALRAFINELHERNKLLMELSLLGLKPKEIAKELGIKIESFYAMKSALLKEIRKRREGR